MTAFQMRAKRSITQLTCCRRAPWLGLAIGLCAAPAQGQIARGISEGSLFGHPWTCVSYAVDNTPVSRSGESWYPYLYNPPTVQLISEPPQLRPRGMAFRNGLLYVTGDWSITQNETVIFNTNRWGELSLHHIMLQPLSTPPPTSTPNNEWWGPEGITFNTGSTGIGANASAIVSVDNLQFGVGNTFALMNTSSGALSAMSNVPVYPEDIAYGRLSQQFFVVQRSPNIIQVYDANMVAQSLSWTLPTRTRGLTVVSPEFGRLITGDATLTGDILLAVCSENPNLTPPAPNRLVAYRADGSMIGAIQDCSWIDLSLDNSSGGGQPGPHTYEAIAVDEANRTIYVGDNAARCVYAIKPVTTDAGSASGTIYGRTWNATPTDVKRSLPSRSGEPWYNALVGQMNEPPALGPEGIAFRNSQLYLTGDWNETQNQIAVFDVSASGVLTFNRAIRMPISNPPPALPNNEMWGPEGVTFNTATTGYGSNASQLITVEADQYLLNGSTRALVHPTTGVVSGTGTWNVNGLGALQPDDIAYGPLTQRLYVLGNDNAGQGIIRVMTNADPPAYAGTQFAVLARAKGVTVLSPAFARFLLSDNTISTEVLLVVAKSDPVSMSAPHNRLAVYRPTGALIGTEQDLVWMREAYPGQPFQTSEGVAVDEANQILYISDEKANAVFVLRVPPPTLTITTTSLPGGVSGQPYSQNVSAQGGAPPYSFSITAGALPPGLTLASSGQISGVPISCGTFGFTVEVRDSQNATASRPLSIDVTRGGIAGDMNADGHADGADVSGFVTAMIAAGGGNGPCAADMNADAHLDSADVALFGQALIGG